jgi:hypothetical protein
MSYLATMISFVPKPRMTPSLHRRPTRPLSHFLHGISFSNPAGSAFMMSL